MYSVFVVVAGLLPGGTGSCDELRLITATDKRDNQYIRKTQNFRTNCRKIFVNAKEKQSRDGNLIYGEFIHCICAYFIENMLDRIR